MFLNSSILQNAPELEVLFYLFHELRHAQQYLRPSLFNEKIRESLPYVILYNGTCYKLVENEWKECALQGSEEYFTRAYLALPYEIDANNFAYKKTREICKDTKELCELFNFWLPKESFDYNEHLSLFRRIDAMIEENEK